MLIRDLVSIDQNAEFRSDVQLSSFDDQRLNLALLNSYLFTSTAPRGWTPSLRLLSTIIDAYLTDRLDNRFVAIADYGHGKSHLALAMANYFSQPIDSPEVQTLLRKITSAAGNAATAARFHDFKQSRGEFLVIRLRGDAPGSLREQVLAGLENALHEHREMQNASLPFWHTTALRFLDGLTPEETERADLFLKDSWVDVPGLRQEVIEKRDVYDLCIQLYAHLHHGIWPNFGGEVGLSQAISWAADTYCGEDKPFGGVLVLFDEFSLYVQRYAKKSAAGDLQDLLNGVSGRQGRVVFLAFAQQDPVTTAKNELRVGPTLQSLRKELTRITKSFQLYSLLESVIDAYLDQPDATWFEFNQDGSVSSVISTACDLTILYFSRRYDRALGWSTEKFQETVARGCFPLHPMTTALLCSVEFQEVAAGAGAPRTVLGFVLEKLSEKGDEPALKDSRVNWVLPVTLVEYFKESIARDRFTAYENALRMVDAGDKNQIAVLKGLLLQEVARIFSNKDDQTVFLSATTGLSEAEVRTALRKLLEARCIRQNPAQQRYMLWSTNVDPDRIEKVVQKHLQAQKLDWQTLQRISKDLFTSSIEVNVDWGAPLDWAATETLMTREFLSRENLVELIRIYQLTPKGMEDGSRGCLVWLLAQDQEEVNWFRQHASAILNEACAGDALFPILLVLPSGTYPELLVGLQRQAALSAFTAVERSDVTSEAYNQEESAVSTVIEQARAEFLGERHNYLDLVRPPIAYVAPLAYRAALLALGKLSVKQALRECYRLAYRYSPPEFFTQYRAAAQGGSKLRDATKMVAQMLMKNGLGANREAVFTNKVAADLCEKFLKGKWHILGNDLRIQEPRNQQIGAAWSLLDLKYKPGAKDGQTHEILIPLLNAPYGYDYNTVTLLFCSWYGYNAHDLEVRAKGRLIGTEQLSKWLQEKGPRDFVSQLCLNRVSLTRRDVLELEHEIRSLIGRVNGENFSQTEAADVAEQLQAYTGEPGGNSELKSSADQAAGNLQRALQDAQQYDREAAAILKAALAGKNIAEFISLLKQIGRLPPSGAVQRQQPPEAELQVKIRESLTQFVDLQCRKWENLKKTTDLALNQNALKIMSNQLNGVGLTGLAKKVEQALVTLDERARSLAAREHEALVQDAIRKMDPSSPLKQLREYQLELQAMTAYSEETTRLRDKQLGLITAEIRQLEQFVSSAILAVKELGSANQTVKFRESLLRSVARYTDTELSKSVETVIEQCQHLGIFFSELDQLKAMPMSSPADVKRRFGLLDELQGRYTDLLSNRQQTLIEEARHATREWEDKQMAKSLSWLETRKQELADGAPLARLVEEIGKPPAFLPPTAQMEYRAIQAAAQEKLELDLVGQIEELFKRIGGEKRRLECLERLQALVGK